jgi:6-phosphogluconolactonase
VQREIHADPEAVAEAGARRIAAAARDAVAARGRFLLALSGGRTPWLMLARLRVLGLPWDRVFVTQVDERVAPDGDPDRNWTHLSATLLAHVAIPGSQQLPMPVDARDLQAAADAHAARLERLAGRPPAFDLVHLGLGPDGHTASLVPGDAALETRAAWVALTGPYQGRQRMTLTLPVLGAARQILWLVTGAEKATMRARLERGDPSIPAGRVRRDAAWLLMDEAAAG